MFFMFTPNPVENDPIWRTLFWNSTTNLPYAYLIFGAHLYNDCWAHLFYIFYFHPYFGKWSNLTNIFQMGWLKPPTRLVYKTLLIISLMSLSTYHRKTAWSWSTFEVDKTPKELGVPKTQNPTGKTLNLAILGVSNNANIWLIWRISP